MLRRTSGVRSPIASAGTPEASARHMEASRDIALVEAAATADQLLLGDGGPLPDDGTELAYTRFEAVARADPERIAIVCGGEQVSYGELDARANRLARRLRAVGVGPEEIV